MGSACSAYGVQEYKLGFQLTVRTQPLYVVLNYLSE